MRKRREGDNEVFTTDVRDDTLGFGGLQHQDLGPGSVRSSEIRDDSLGGSEVLNGSLIDRDIAQSNGAHRNFPADIGSVPANSCVYRAVTGINSTKDHLVLTPNFNTTSSFLTYGIEYEDVREQADIKVCNPTNGAINDGITRFNLLVINGVAGGQVSLWESPPRSDGGLQVARGYRTAYVPGEALGKATHRNSHSGGSTGGVRAANHRSPASTTSLGATAGDADDERVLASAVVDLALRRPPSKGVNDGPRQLLAAQSQQGADADLALEQRWPEVRQPHGLGTAGAFPCRQRTCGPR